MTSRKLKKQVKKIKKRYSPRFVYLAGPIMGCNFAEANDWRKAVAHVLHRINIVGVSPLRCEPMHGPIYTADYPDEMFGTPRAIAAKNKFDVRTSDITLAILPKPKKGRPQSYGTIIEIAWANALGKQVILCTDDPIVAKHPVIDSCANWKLVTRSCSRKSRFRTLEDCVRAGVEVCTGVLGGYSGGKNV